ncbi:MAG: hypothetical protein QME94_06410, partial [Anaerolineae bacterium]|nr:hypothetical protein [Anaerolineae bacterium]
MANGARSRVLLALVALLLLTGCVGAPARSPRPGPDWSRGIQIGECSVNGVVALYPEPDGSRIHLAWPQTAEEGDRIHYAQLDSQGRTAVEVSLPLAVRSPRHVRVLPDGAGGLIICYVSGIAEGRRLYSAHLDASGRLLSEPVQVSEIDLQVDEYAAEPAAAGVDIFWSNNDYYTRGVYHLRLDQAGRVAAPSKLVAPQGISPDAKAGSDGQLHVTWVHEPDYYEENILYAAFDAGKRELAQPVRLGYFALSPRSTRFGPVLGLSSGHVHVVWSWEHLASGGTAVAGEAECRQASFPLGDPGAARERAVVMPPTSRPAYAPERGGFAYTQLARIDGGASALVYMPGFAGGQRDEAALAVSYAVSSRVGSYVWVGVTYLAGEAARGYQVAAAAKRIAMRPVLAADQHGRLHLAWLEPAGFGRYLVFYASMAPQTRAALGRLGYDDVVDAGYA